ncbi:DUF6093 family protein [Brachybacterium alimentarium]|uniref:DUF6093 family protein n=1 Tax=Brachybacterium alimentarium TaxID=47845 RepID=UPI000DF3A5AF|nr:DUF6093 family protein [Brachybacterium alimentarium]RCS81329.1 hypothetical protein CIK67_16275 [Brachybacterium alimentarium]
MPRMDRTIRLGQRMAESLMADTVRVTRADPDAEPTWDEDGNILEPDPLVVYEGRAKFQHSDPYPSTPDAGEARWTTGVRQVHFPIGTTAVQTGDVTECVASLNERLVGLKVRMRIDGDKTWTTAVRFNVIETVQTNGGGGNVG